MNGYRETAWRAEDVRPTIFQHFNDFAAKPVWLRLGDNLYGRVNPFFSDRGLDRRYLRSAPLRRFHQWLSSRMACAERARFPTLPLERVRQHPEGAAWSAGLLLPELALSAHLLPYPGLPGVIAALMELSRIVGDGPDYYIPLIASSFAALAAAPTFGVETWHFYLLGELGVWGGGAATLVLLAGLGARRMPLPLAAAVTIIAVHSAIAHKEYRFIYPAIMLVMAMAGIGLAQVAAWGRDWLLDRGVRPRTATAGSVALVLSWWCLVSFHVWTGAALTAHRYRGHDNLRAVSFVAHGSPVCGLGLYGLDGEDWGNYGGYTYLHRPVPMYWPKDDAEFDVLAAGFDTLVYIKAPPEGLGFTPQRCFGQVCVARRSGGCAPLPMLAMPFPAPVPRPPAARQPVTPEQ